MTKKQQEQLGYYKQLLETVCNDSDTGGGFCYYIIEMIFSNSYLKKKADKIKHSKDYMEKLFPELYAYKPKQLVDERGKVRKERTFYDGTIIHADAYNLYWFACNTTGWKKRIAILGKIIKELDEALKN
jgi:hypothetical protein